MRSPPHNLIWELWRSCRSKPIYRPARVSDYGWKSIVLFFSPLLFLRPLLLRFKWKLSAIAFQCSLLLELQLVGGWPLHSHCGCSTFYYNYFSYSFFSCCVHSFQAFFLPLLLLIKLTVRVKNNNKLWTVFLLRLNFVQGAFFVSMGWFVNSGFRGQDYKALNTFLPGTWKGYN